MKKHFLVAFLALTSLVSCSQPPSSTLGSSQVDKVKAELTVSNVAALSVIDASTFNDGDLIYVDSLKSHFSLEPSTQTTVPYVRVTAYNRSGYEWIRFGTSPAWWSSDTWWVDPVASNDENVGTAVGAPLKTNAEFGRRMYQREPTTGDPYKITINYLGDVVDGDALVYQGGPSWMGAQTTIIAQCLSTVLVSGTISTALPLDPDHDQGNAIALPGVTSWAPYVGKIVRLQGTPTTSAVIEADLGGGMALLSGQYVNGNDGYGFTAGQTVEVVQGSKLPDVTVDVANSSVTLRNCLIQTNGVVRMNVTSNSSSGSMSATQSEFLNTTGAYTYFNAFSTTLNGSSIVGRAFFNGAVGGIASSFINGPVYLSGGIWEDHWDDFGAWNAQIGLGYDVTVRLHNDFHSGGLPAGGVQFFGYGGSRTFWAQRWYGQGNDPASIGVQLEPDTGFFVNWVPTVNTGIAFQVPVPGFGYVSHPWSDMPYHDNYEIYVSNVP